MTTSLPVTPSTTPGRRGLAVGLVVAVIAAALAVVGAAGPAEAAVPECTGTLNDGAVFPDGFVVPAGKVCEFNPNKDTHVIVKGNVVVEGTLKMRPSKGSVEHTLKFRGIDESKFVGGGGMNPDPDDFPNDIGLWVVGNGKLDLKGTKVTPWARSWQSGWSGDVVKKAPHRNMAYTSFKSISGAGGVPTANGHGYKAELLNLTRNVRIHGTKAGKTHIHIHSTKMQTIKYVEIRYVAPDINGGSGESGGHITGRYGLHFHHNGGSSRGTVVKGVVIRDADNHSFVPHKSHGITFRDTIAFSVTGEAYWWDESTASTCPVDDEDCNETDDIHYDGVVAAKITPNPYRKHEAAAIQLGGGDDNKITDSVVVGMQNSGQNVAAYRWPSNDRGVWTFRRNMAHNNESQGIFVWQNTSGDPDKNHVIDGFTAYFNAKTAIDHGAYANSYVYKNLVLLGTANDEAVHSHALGKAASSGGAKTQKWSGIETGGDDLVILRHGTAGNKHVQFSFCDFGKVIFEEGSTGVASVYRFVECNLKKSDFDMSNADPDSIVKVQDDGKAFKLTAKGVKTTIAPFVSNPQPPKPTPGT